MVQYRYSITELGDQVRDRAGSSRPEEAVLDILKFWGPGSLEDIRVSLSWASSHPQDVIAWSEYEGMFKREYEGHVREIINVHSRAADPLKLRQIIAGLENRGLVKKVGSANPRDFRIGQ